MTTSLDQPTLFDVKEYIVEPPKIEGEEKMEAQDQDIILTHTVTEAVLVEVLEKIKVAPTLELLKTELNKLRNSLVHRNGEVILTSVNPSYLIDEIGQIQSSLTLDRAKYYTNRLIKGLTQIRTASINDINLNRWKEYEEIYTDSLWVIDKRDKTGVHSAGYWGNFIPQIPQQMIKRYTKKGELILDTFLGSGTTLIESQRLGRNGIGIELQEEVAQKTRSTIAFEPNNFDVFSEVLTGDSASIDYQQALLKLGKKSAQLIIMHPPYHDIIKFSGNSNDLSNAPTTEEFISKMGTIIKKGVDILDKGRYLVIVIGDKYSKGEWIPLGFLTMNEALNYGLTLKSIIVKNFEETTGKRNQKELWRYRALAQGFYVFKHEYIFLLQKK